MCSKKIIAIPKINKVKVLVDGVHSEALHQYGAMDVFVLSHGLFPCLCPARHSNVRRPSGLWVVLVLFELLC